MTSINKDKIKKQLTKARIGLINWQPFWGTLAMRLQLVEMPEHMRATFPFQPPTLAVDGRKIYYAPEFIDQLSHHDTMTVIAHEVSHCVFEHLLRRGSRNPILWNFAGDYVINLQLKAAGFNFTHASGWLCDDKYKDMSTDQVYNLLARDAKKMGAKSNGSGGNPLCNILDGESKTDSTLADDWKLAVAQSAMTAQKAGKLPAGMERFVDELLNPKINWREQLRRFLTEVSKDDYSWRRPVKHMITYGYYLPTLYSEQMRQMVVVVDTSGSIDNTQLQCFASEIEAIRATVRPAQTIVIYCDADVAHVDTFAAGELGEYKLHGGGGTDFRPPFDYVEAQGLNPQCLAYLTDGYGPFPDAPAPFPTIWAITTDVQPPWGERLQLDVDA